jgi:hypothetical protein
VSKLVTLPGDIVLVLSDGFVGWRIRSRTREKGEAPTWVNHVMLCTRRPLEVLDAQPPIVQVRSLRAYAPGGDYERCMVAIYRARDLTFEERLQIADRAMIFNGRRYGFVKIGLHAVGLQQLCYRDDTPICSYGTGAPYDDIKGWTFNGRPGRHSVPDDIADELIDVRPDRWECTRELKPLRLEEVE